MFASETSHVSSRLLQPYSLVVKKSTRQSSEGRERSDDRKYVCCLQARQTEALSVIFFSLHELKHI